MLRHIIFDFGNVFIEWNPRRIFRKVYSEKETEYIMQHVWSEDWNNNLDRGVTFTENEKHLCAAYPHCSEYVNVFHRHWYESLGEVNPESVALLSDLQRAGYKTYGLSNWSAETFPLTVEKHPFFRTFNGIVLSSDFGICKPDPEIYRILLKRYRLQADECAFIDDRQKNVETARRLGIRGIVFQTAKQVREELNQFINRSF